MALSASRSERVKSFGMEGFGTVKTRTSGVAICCLPRRKTRPQKPWRAAHRCTLPDGTSELQPGYWSGVLRADAHDLAGHVGRVVAGQERDHGGDLPGFGRSPERLSSRQLVEHVAAGDLGQERVH